MRYFTLVITLLISWVICSSSIHISDSEYDIRITPGYLYDYNYINRELIIYEFENQKYFTQENETRKYQRLSLKENISFENYYIPKFFETKRGPIYIFSIYEYDSIKYFTIVESIFRNLIDYEHQFTIDQTIKPTGIIVKDDIIFLICGDSSSIKTLTNFVDFHNDSITVSYESIYVPSNMYDVYDNNYINGRIINDTLYTMNVVEHSRKIYEHE